MEAKAIEHIIALVKQADGKTVEIDGVTYSTGPLTDVRKKDPMPETLRLNSLDGVIGYLNSEFDGPLSSPLAIWIEDPTNVKVISALGGHFMQRAFVVHAQSPVSGGYKAAKNWTSIEDMIIHLNVSFDDSDGRTALLEVLSGVTDQSTLSLQDDGVSQAVTAKAGVSLFSEVKVPNPVPLRPWRTFREIEQPAGPFLFRMRRKKDSPPECMLMACDDPNWQLYAISAIRAELTQKLDKSWVILG